MREYLLVALVGGVTTYLLCGAARICALRIGAIAQVRDRDVHATPIPYLGGVAMYGGIVAAYGVATRLPFLGSSSSDILHDAGRVIMIAGLICALGAVDDIFDLSATIKLVGQILAAALLVVANVQFYSFPLLDKGEFVLTPTQSQILTIVVVVACVNAVNFVDGLDGLAAGVVTAGAAAFFLYAYVIAARQGEPRSVTAALLCSTLIGACVGFLPHNFHPARMFMGDAGSMLTGFLLAASAITLTGQFSFSRMPGYFDHPVSTALPTIVPIVLPAAILAVPIIDMGLAVVRRTRSGVSVFNADKQHVHHRMLEIGHSHRRAVLLLWLWAATLAFGMVLIGLAPSSSTVGVLSLVLTINVVLTRGIPGFLRFR